MKERPILFSGPMIRAINDLRKNQTRRLVGLETFDRSATPGYDWTFRGRAPVRSIAGQRRHSNGCWQDLTHAQLLDLCPYGIVGDRLWVKETWQTTTTPEDLDVAKLVYAADWDGKRPGFAEDEWTWRSSIFMPRWASRITLEITEVRVQRLQEISEADTIAEGARHFPYLPSRHPYGQDSRWSMEEPTSTDDCLGSPRSAFANYVNKLHHNPRQPDIWEVNPWAWAITFARLP